MIKESRLDEDTVPIHSSHISDRINEGLLVSAYGDSVYRFCLSLVYRREDADDLFQDTYLHAFSKIGKIGESKNPQCFLFSLATSIWKSQKRKYARRNRLAPQMQWDDACDCGYDNMEDHALAKEETLFVRKLVSALPDKLRIPVIMYYTAEMTVADIAQTLNQPAGTIKSHLSRARGIIKKGLENEYGNE